MNELTGLADYRAIDEPGYLARAFPSNQPRRVCFISRTTASNLGFSEKFFGPGMMMEQNEDLAAAVRLLASRRSGCSFALINYDDFAGEVGAIDLLRRLRSRSPNLPVVLLSKTFSADDLSQERLAITDISLVTPIRDDSVIGPALEIAAANNVAWRKRRRWLMLEKVRHMH